VLSAAFGQAGGVDGGFGPAAHAQLRKQVGRVVLDGLLGQEQPFTDLTVGQSFDGGIKDATFLVGETGELIRLGGLARPLEDPGRRRQVEQRLASADSADTIDRSVPRTCFSTYPEAPADKASAEAAAARLQPPPSI